MVAGLPSGAREQQHGTLLDDARPREERDEDDGDEEEGGGGDEPLEGERLRAGLEEARRRHDRALLAAAERAASGRLRAAEAELVRALRRNAELEDRERQVAAECQAWMGVARSHEAVAAGLRATLDQLLQSSPCAAATVGEGEAEDAQSCCFEAPAAADGNDDAASRSRAAASSCKACGGGEACVLLLPCRHLCLCRACEAAVDACPVCAPPRTPRSESCSLEAYRIGVHIRQPIGKVM